MGTALSRGDGVCQACCEEHVGHQVPAGAADRLTVLLSEAQWVDRVEPGGWSTLFVLPSLRVVEGEEGPVRGNASWGCI